MLDRVGDVGQPAVDPRLRERLVEDPAGGPHERPAREILLVTGLFADEDDLRPCRAFAEDRLRPGLPEVAGLAARGSLTELRQRSRVGNGSLGLHPGRQ